jgi:hypothetical protein
LHHDVRQNLLRTVADHQPVRAAQRERSLDRLAPRSASMPNAAIRGRRRSRRWRIE